MGIDMADTAVSSGSTARTGRSTLSSPKAERRFFLLFAIFLALVVFAGFTPSFYLKNVFHVPPPLSAMTWVHGIVFTGWTLLFVTQAALIDAGNPALHRRLGLLGAVLLGVVLAIGVMTGINAGRLGHAPPGAPAPLLFMAVPLMGILATAILFIAALWNRARRDVHMRYMLAGFITMMPPATFRLTIGIGGLAIAPHAILIALFLMNLFVVAGMLYDGLAQNRVHPAWLWSAVVILATEAGIWWAFTSPQWLPVAQWLVQT